MSDYSPCATCRRPLFRAQFCPDCTKRRHTPTKKTTMDIRTYKRSIEEFAAILQASLIFALNRDHVACDANISNQTTRIRPGIKYTKVDVGTSGKYMVENTTGIIYGIKAYGKIHKGHSYGTLSTIHLWDWAHYTAVSFRGLGSNSEVERRNLAFSRQQEEAAKESATV